MEGTWDRNGRSGPFGRRGRESGRGRRAKPGTRTTGPSRARPRARGGEPAPPTWREPWGTTWTRAEPGPGPDPGGKPPPSLSSLSKVACRRLMCAPARNRHMGDPVARQKQQPEQDGDFASGPREGSPREGTRPRTVPGQTAPHLGLSEARLGTRGDTGLVPICVSASDDGATGGDASTARTRCAALPFPTWARLPSAGAQQMSPLSPEGAARLALVGCPQTRAVRPACPSSPGTAWFSR